MNSEPSSHDKHHKALHVHRSRGIFAVSGTSCPAYGFRGEGEDERSGRCCADVLSDGRRQPIARIQTPVVLEGFESMGARQRKPSSFVVRVVVEVITQG